MKRIDIEIDKVITWSAYKDDLEYERWIEVCVRENLWGKPDTYNILITDATEELEAIRASKELPSKQYVDLHINSQDNPHNTTKDQIGLGSVDNVSAADLRNRSTHTGNETRLTWSEGATITTPVAGLTTYAKDIGGRQMFAQKGKSGVDYSFQPFFGRNSIFLHRANGNTTASTTFGNVAPTAGGTATVRNVATTNFFTWMRRIGYISTTTGNSSSGLRHSQLQYGIGNAAGLGGFHFVARFGISDAVLVPGARLFAGMLAGTGVIGNSDPSTLTNIIGVGLDAADTTLQIMHNDGAGNATKINLGASFPESTNADFYELALYCAPNGTAVFYEVVNLTTGVEASGSITTNLPLNTQLLTWQIWRHNVATGVAVGVDIASIYIETDN